MRCWRSRNPALANDCCSSGYATRNRCCITTNPSGATIGWSAISPPEPMATAWAHALASATFRLNKEEIRQSLSAATSKSKWPVFGSRQMPLCAHFMIRITSAYVVNLQSVLSVRVVPDQRMVSQPLSPPEYLRRAIRYQDAFPIRHIR